MLHTRESAQFNESSTSRRNARQVGEGSTGQLKQLNAESMHTHKLANAAQVSSMLHKHKSAKAAQVSGKQRL
jgi:hypothetical protein